MKKLFTLLAVAITLIVSAQAPQGFNYQATVRNTAGELISNKSVSFKFSILLNSDLGTEVYSENQTATTDELGHIALVVGQGTNNTVSFSSINWASGTYYLGIKLDTGSGYVAMGTTQLLSVPYALYANRAGNSQPVTPNLASVLAVNNSANNTKITNLQNPTDIQDAATKGYIDSQLQTQVAQLQAQITALINATAAPLPNVIIGTQVWTKTNLDVTTYRDGTPIPEVQDPTAWAGLTTGAWCYYNNNPANGAVYGKLYNWYAVAGIYDAASLANPALRKQFAPTGWHVPTDPEWSILINYLDPNADGGNTFPNVAGGKMKSTGTIQASTGLWQSPNTAATNESGFTGLPGGYRYNYGPFYVIGDYGIWWSSSESSSTADAWLRNLYYNDGHAYRSYGPKRHGFSVRCLRD